MSSLARRQRIIVMCLVCAAAVASLLVSMVAVHAGTQGRTPLVSVVGNTITVNSTADTAADDGVCTLREAITSANNDTASGASAGECAAGSGADTINFSVTGTITLASALPEITSSVTVSGPGAQQLAVSGNNLYRVFSVAAGTVVFQKLTVENGRAPDGPDAQEDCTSSDCSSDGGVGEPGGGILNEGTLTLNGVVVANNSAGNGGQAGNVSCTNSDDDCSTSGGRGGAGGGVSSSGTLTVTSSTFSNNHAGSGGAAGSTAGCAGGASCSSTAGNKGNGGGYFGGDATITGTTFSGNTAYDGGAVQQGNNLTVTDSTFSGNSSDSTGGALNCSSGSLPCNISGSTFSGNSTTYGGGALAFFNDGVKTVTNSTVSGNSALNNGGGIFAQSCTVNLVSVTVASNTCDSDNNGSGDGGGIYNVVATVNLGNSIVANNTDKGGQSPDVSGSIQSQGFNLIENTAGAVISDAANPGTNITGQDPKLGPLQNNGGPTQTQALLYGSPAIDKGKDLSGTGKDQRGFGRPVNLPDTTYPNATGGDGSDIGAFEVQPPNTAPVASATPNPAVTNEDTPVQITLQGTDVDDNNLTFTITQQPTNGTLSAVSSPDCAPVNTCTATVTYTPTANYNGADSFKFKANDGTVDSNEVTVNITINPVADLSINDVAKAEGNTGTTTFTFTVSLDSPAPAGGVTFNASTADGTATVANNDYVGFTNQPGTIPAGSTSTTVDVTVNGDTVQESNETFFVNITNVTNATVADGQGQGTILNDDGAPTAGQIIISEFRLSGPGAGPTPSPTDQANDEFIELYNATDSDFVVADSSPVNISGSGWALVSSDDPVTPKYIIPAGTRIPARGHYLVANGLGYSLSLYPAGNNGTNTALAPAADASTGAVSSTSTTTAIADGFYYTDIPDNAGLALFRTGNPVLFAAPAERLDAVGFTGSAFFEGTPLQPVGGITARVQHSFVRKQTTGRPLDTNNNQNDFVLVSTTGGTINGVAAQLGAPGPENLSSPLNLGGQIKSTLLDPAVSTTASPNRVRDSTAGSGPTAAGTLELRRTFTNKTGADVTRLRFRIVDVTAGSGAPAGTADVRALTSVTLSNVSITGNNGACPSNLCTVQGTTLEVPPTQGNGGGLNSSLSVDAISGTTVLASSPSIVETVSLAGPLAPNSSINVRFMLGVAQTGSFRFFVIVEALSGTSFSTAQPAPANNLDSPKGSLLARQKSLPGAAKGALSKSDQ